MADPTRLPALMSRALAEAVQPKGSYEVGMAMLGDSNVELGDSDMTDIGGNLTTTASATVVSNTVTTAIDDLDELREVGF